MVTPSSLIPPPPVPPPAVDRLPACRERCGLSTLCVYPQRRGGSRAVQTFVPVVPGRGIAPEADRAGRFERVIDLPAARHHEGGRERRCETGGSARETARRIERDHGRVRTLKRSDLERTPASRGR